VILIVNTPHETEHTHTHTHTKTQLGNPWSSQDQGMTLQTLNKLPTLIKNKYANIGDMGVPIFTIDQDVLKKYEDKMIEKGLKYIAYVTLEDGWCIKNSKWHHQELIMAFKSAKRSFRNVCFLHVNLVIIKMEIKFSEELSFFELIQVVINDRNGELILECYFFERSKVRAHVPSVLLFEDHENC
jgi:hypothetical protein